MKTHIKLFLLLLAASLTSNCTEDPLMPLDVDNKITIEKPTISAITQTEASSLIMVTGLESDVLIEKGICWSTKTNPTLVDKKISGGSGMGQLNSKLLQLSPGTIYYVRGYFKTNHEMVYSDQVQFRTVDFQLSTVTTKSVTGITLTSAIGNGSVSGAGGSTVTSRGLCWSSTTASPTLANSSVAVGGGLGDFSSNITGLTPNTVYYIRAYAANQAGVSYANAINFTTESIKLATVSSSTITSVTTTSGLVNASVTADGGGTISAKGLCWSILSSPTISNSRTLLGSGIGDVSSNITGLNPATTYYVRAYATNQAGTTYGSQASFTTLSVNLATISSLSVSSITKSTALISGNVTNDGGGAVTSRGICYGTSINPTISSNTYNNNGSGIGTVSYSVSGLFSGTTYYVRAYAVNSAGVSYGIQSSFKTL